MAGEAAFDAFDKIVLTELTGADIDAQAEPMRVHQVFVDQFFKRLAGLIEDPVADLKNQSAVFQYFDELVG
ncbi:hypothetical protein D3C72_2380350 [compost metagenome]